MSETQPKCTPEKFSRYFLKWEKWIIKKKYYFLLNAIYLVCLLADHSDIQIHFQCQCEVCDIQSVRDNVKISRRRGSWEAVL